MFKSLNNQKLPLAFFRNLREYEPSLHTRHVIIAVSGWLSEKDCSGSEWSQLINYTQNSRVGLVSYNWKANKPGDLVGAVADKAKEAA